MSNLVYIATSIDGYIGDRENKLDWLEMVPNPEHSDFGFAAFMDRVDALVMGRLTYETVLGFGGEWPYTKPVFVCSHKLKAIPDKLKGQVSLIQGSPKDMTENLNHQGFKNLYIDGGRTIQSFLKADLIDEMIISKIPILLGGGVPLFESLPEHREFELLSADILLNQIVSLRYRRKFD